MSSLKEYRKYSIVSIVLFLIAWYALGFKLVYFFEVMGGEMLMLFYVMIYFVLLLLLALIISLLNHTAKRAYIFVAFILPSFILCAVFIIVHSKVIVPMERNKEDMELQKTISTLYSQDWQTYKSEKYGFEFKYPSSWTIKEKSYESSTGDNMVAFDGVFIQDSSQTQIGVLKIKNDDLLIEEYFNNKSNSDKGPLQRLGSKIINSRTLTIDNIPAWNYENFPSDIIILDIRGDWILLEKNSDIFAIVLVSNGTENTNVLPIFSRILTTLRFL